MFLASPPPVSIMTNHDKIKQYDHVVPGTARGGTLPASARAHYHLDHEHAKRSEGSLR